MAIPRVIPTLLLKNDGLVKTRKFKDPVYVGDPINAVKIFNDKEVDELAFLDITATVEKRVPPLGLLEKIAGECFMPLSYGGGINKIEMVRDILKVGVEKVIINTAAILDPEFVRLVSERYGTSTIAVSIDVKKNFWGKEQVAVMGGKKSTGKDPIRVAVQLAEMGAGEILLTSIDREGSMRGYDVELIRRVASEVDIPVIASGGAGKIDDFREAMAAGAASVAAGSMFVFHGKHRAILITYPPSKDLASVFKK